MMAYCHYDRLTALDESFLALEDANVHMHVGSVGIFDAGPLLGPEGALDMESILALSEWSLLRAPRFRQRLAWIPGFGNPVWVDDVHFNSGYHLRHTSLPAPGDERQLKRLAGRIMSQQLDRAKPLWEMWFVEGLEGDRFAVITKVHHCMIDGVSASDLLSAFMGANPDHRPSAVKAPWVPRPAPSGAVLFRNELMRRASVPLRGLELARSVAREPVARLRELASGIEGIRETITRGFSSASDTPLNEPIGPHRRFDWFRFELDDVKEVKERNACTLNDVVLATVSLGIRAFLRGRDVDVDELDFRALVPVNIRRPEEQGALGNRVAFLTVSLPVGEADPHKCLTEVSRTMQEQKASPQVAGAELLELLTDALAPGLMGGLTRLATRSRPYNIVVTNVPGPTLSTYMLGAQLLETYPLVPLFSNQAAGIALFSYDGGLYWGLNADWESIPDLHDLVRELKLAFESLRKK
jgi:WS/DGAT/MGAT family acyltransferase